MLRSDFCKRTSGHGLFALPREKSYVVRGLFGSSRGSRRENDQRHGSATSFTNICDPEEAGNGDPHNPMTTKP